MFEEKYDVIVFCLISLLASISIFLRPVLFGYDSYAFVSYLNGFTPAFGGHDLFFLIIKLFPNSFLFFDVVMWLCLFIAVLGLFFGLKQVFSRQTAFLATLICLGAAPIMVFSFSQFQNELFAYPFIFWSFYCLMSKFKYYNWIALGFGLAGCFFWQGSFVWVGIVALGLVLPFLACLLVALPFIWKKITFAFTPLPGVAFNTPLWGLIDYFLLFPFIFGVFLGKNKRWQVWVVVSLVCVCLSARFTIISIPFIALGIGIVVDRLLIKWFSFKNIVLICFFLIICWNIALFMQHPIQNELSLSSDFVKDCKNLNYSPSPIKPIDFNIQKLTNPKILPYCVNDWSLGWWVTSVGGATQFKANPPDPDYNQLAKPFLALTTNNLDCNLVNKQGFLNYYKC